MAMSLKQENPQGLEQELQELPELLGLSDLFE